MFNVRVSLAALIAASLMTSLAAQRASQAPAAGPAPALEIQVLLDRAGFSPGEIDGKFGSNTSNAISAFQLARHLQPGPPDDPALRQALGAGSVPTLVAYTVTPEDAAGPFTSPIPDDMMEKAKLPALNYSSLEEALGERFHVSPALLRALNPGAQFAAGASIQVPNTGGTPPTPAAPAAVAANVIVSKSHTSATAFDATGAVIFYAPVTSGSEHDPLPIGSWKVTGISRNPVFNYNPDLFWDAKSNQAKARIPAGPNGPVGVVWIDITKEHYGLHGTPEPGQIGHTSSHGCVRLTNWDAVRLASLVKAGTPIVFIE